MTSTFLSKCATVTACNAEGVGPLVDLMNPKWIESKYGVEP